MASLSILPSLVSSSPQSFGEKVAVLAGRRPDALTAATERFPLTQVPFVKQHLYRLFQTERFTMLICAAACGADLLALEVAGELGISAHIVLPFAPELFRRTSVVDRPGNWGTRYDQVITHAKHRGQLTVLHLPVGDPQTYLLTNQALIAQTSTLGRWPSGSTPPCGVLVWDGVARGPGDVTQHFRKACRQAGFREIQVSTLPTII
jgi:hypothetical protein